MWNYRVVQTLPNAEDADETWEIVEAYYGPDGRVNGFGPSSVAGDSLDGLRRVYGDMAQAFQGPPVTFDAETGKCSDPDSWRGKPWPTKARVEFCAALRGEEVEG